MDITNANSVPTAMSAPVSAPVSAPAPGPVSAPAPGGSAPSADADANQIQILNNIARLQKMEKDLYKELEAASAAGTSAAAPANTTRIINSINQLSQIRISLFKSLNNSYLDLQKNLTSTRTDVTELLKVVSIAEESLNTSKENLNHLSETKNNKMRMVQINTYFGKKYKAQAGLMKLIIVVSIILLLLAFLRKNGVLPESIANILMGIVFLVGGFFILRRVLDISSRDNMNFDAYTWNFDPDDTQINNYSHKKKKAKDSDRGSGWFSGMDCIGPACCTAGMKYDEASRTCIKNVAPETFVSGQLTKHCFNNKPSRNTSPDFAPVPYGSEDSVNFASV